MSQEFVAKKGFITPGNATVTGSLTVLGGVTGSFSGSHTGSLYGTASYALTASTSTSASYGLSSSFANSASVAISASFAPSSPSPFSTSASFASQSLSASLVNISSSNSNTAYEIVLDATNTGSAQQLLIDGGMTFTYNPNTDTLTVPNLTASNQINGTASFAVSASWAPGGSGGGSLGTGSTYPFTSSWALAAVSTSINIASDSGTYYINFTPTTGSSGSINVTSSITVIPASGSIQATSFTGSAVLINGNLINGSGSVLSGSFVHIEGHANTARGPYSHVEGQSAYSIGTASHAEGGAYSGIQGYISSNVSNGVITLASAYGDVHGSFPNNSIVVFDDSNFDFSYGITTFSVSTSVFSSPNTVITLWDTTVNTTTTVLGSLTHPTSLFLADMVIGGIQSHAEGSAANTIGQFSHAEGSNTVAFASYTHAEGQSTKAYGQYSHAEGSGVTTVGLASHAGGLSTIASGSYQTVVGQYNNKGNTSDYFVVGGGTSDSARKDLFNVNSTGIVVNNTISASAVTASLFGTASYAMNVNLPASWTQLSLNAAANISFSNVSALPASVGGLCPVIVSGSIFFYGGWSPGGSPTVTNSIWSAPVSNPWAVTDTLNTLPVTGALFQPSNIQVIGNTIYFFGGEIHSGASQGVVSASNVIYTASVSSPSKVGDSGGRLPVRLGGNVVFTSGSFLYSVFGSTGSWDTFNTPLTQIASGSLFTGSLSASISQPLSWSFGPVVDPGPPTNLSKMCVRGQIIQINNTLYVYGGYAPISSSTSTDYSNRSVFTASISTPTTWGIATSSMPTFVDVPGLIAIGQTHYMLGGGTPGAGVTISGSTGVVWAFSASAPLVPISLGKLFQPVGGGSVINQQVAVVALPPVPSSGNNLVVPVFLYGGFDDGINGETNAIYSASINIAFAPSASSSIYSQVGASGTTTLEPNFLYNYQLSSSWAFNALSANSASFTLTSSNVAWPNYGFTYLGYQAGLNATSTANATLIGYQVASAAVSTFNDAVVIGHVAGSQTTDAFQATLIGSQAGNAIANFQFATCVGWGAGAGGNTALSDTSVIIGYQAGQNAYNSRATLVGANTGNSSTLPSAVIIGYNAGSGIINGSASIQIGYNAGQNSSTTSGSIIIGYNAGQTALTSSNAVLIGFQAGTAATGSSIVNSVAIGPNALVGAPNTFVVGGTGSAALKMAIGAQVATNSLDVVGNISCSVITGSLFAGAGGVTIAPFYLNNYGTGSNIFNYYPNVAAFSTGSSFSGSILISTPIQRNTANTFIFHVHGFGSGSNTDAINYYVRGELGTVTASFDGQSGSILRYSLHDLGSDGLPKLLGITSGSAGVVALGLGYTSSVYNNYSLRVDYWALTAPTPNPFVSWSIAPTTSSLYGMTSSVFLTASYIPSASYALTSSFASLAATASFTQTASFIATFATNNQWSRGGTLYNASYIPNTITWISIWRAPFTCTASAFNAYCVGLRSADSASVNARKNGASNLLSASFACSGSSTFFNLTALQNNTFVVGDRIEIGFLGTTGSINQIDIQLDMNR